MKAVTLYFHDSGNSDPGLVAMTPPDPPLEGDHHDLASTVRPGALVGDSLAVGRPDHRAASRRTGDLLARARRSRSPERGPRTGSCRRSPSHRRPGRARGVIDQQLHLRAVGPHDVEIARTNVEHASGRTRPVEGDPHAVG